MKAKLFFNWKTTLAGLAAGLPLIAEGITTKNISLIVTGAGMVIMGVFGRDSE
jgi:hypothetical protein